MVSVTEEFSKSDASSPNSRDWSVYELNDRTCSKFSMTLSSEGDVLLLLATDLTPGTTFSAIVSGSEFRGVLWELSS